MDSYLDTILKAQGWRENGSYTLTKGTAKLIADTSHWYELYIDDKRIIDIPNPDNISDAGWKANVINKLIELSSTSANFTSTTE